MSTQTYTGTLTVQDCINCGTTFGVEQSLDKRLRKNGNTFFCPNGHGQVYRVGRSEEQKLREQLEAEQRRLIREREWRADTEARLVTSRRQAAAARGQVTKIKRRVGRGVCPCCNRTFADLGRHMAGQHPDFADQGQA